jgi:hypothetical protein
MRDDREKARDGLAKSKEGRVVGMKSSLSNEDGCSVYSSFARLRWYCTVQYPLPPIIVVIKYHSVSQ